MDRYLHVLLGSALLTVLLALSDHSDAVAHLLCASGLHRWRMTAHTARRRTCTCCRRVEVSTAQDPRPWEWSRDP